MKTKFDEDIDMKIRKCLRDDADEIKASDNMFFKVRSEIMKKNEGRLGYMKLSFLKVKTIVAIGAIFVLSSVACVAGTNNFGWFGSSSNLTETKDFPTENTVEKTVGFTPKYVDSFDCGFKFDTFNFENKSLQNEDTGDAILKLKSADFDYKREDSERNQVLSMSAEQIDEQYFNEDEAVTKGEMTEYKGIKIYYTHSKQKFVPEGYVKTDEEIKEEKEGTLGFGFGGPDQEIEESNTQFVIWYEDGIQYSIFNMAYDDVSQEDMIHMAEKVIDK